MTNLIENPIWESGIYQIEKSDLVEGGPDGISNLQAKQLANRTGFLLSELHTANLRIDEALDNSDNLAVQAALEGVISDIGVLSKEMTRTQEVYDQSGQITLYNRGLISGGALHFIGNRLIRIEGGRCFMFGREWTFPSSTVEIPPNPHSSTLELQLCLIIGNNECNLMVGRFQEYDGVILYNLSLPPDNTMATDPNMNQVSAYFVGRYEPHWPEIQASPAHYQVWLSKVMPGAYSLSFDVIGWIGNERPTVLAPFENRADNTFRVYCSGA